MPTNLSTPLRSDLLRTVCTYLPEIDARWIEARDPSDYLTHIEAYACVRRNQVTLPRELMRAFANGLVHYLERPTSTIDAD